MSEKVIGNQAAIIAAYDIRAAAIATANRLKSQATLGAARARAISYDPRARSGPKHLIAAVSRTITLELTKSPARPQFSTSTAVIAAAFGSASPAPPEPERTILTLDVSANSDGYAQRVSIQSTARQTTHQTVIGNYVDEWGIAIGQLDVDLLVLYGAVPGSQIQSFFDLLESAKRTSPNSSEPPSILRFHDSFLQRSLIISQESLRLEEVAEKQNHARLSINADILHDYGTAQFPIQKTTDFAQDANLVSSIFSGLKFQ